MPRLAAAAALLAALSSPLLAQDAVTAGSGTAPTLELAMADLEWIGRPPLNPYWADDGERIFFERDRDDDGGRDVFVISHDGQVERVPDHERHLVDTRRGDLDADRSRKVYTRHGDLFVKDMATGIETQLLRTPDRESWPQFLLGDERIAFRRGDEVFVRDLSTGVERLLVSFATGEEPAPDGGDDASTPSFLEAQQERLFEIVRERERRGEVSRERRDALQELDPTRPPDPVHVGRGRTVGRFALSPTARHVLASLVPTDAPRARRDTMAEWIDASGYASSRSVRPLVGTSPRAGSDVALIDVATGALHQLDLSALPGITDDPLAEIRETSAARAEGWTPDGGTPPAPTDDGTDDDETPDDAAPRDVSVLDLRWSRDGRYASVMLRSVDNKDRWIVVLDTQTDGEAPYRLDVVHHLHDPAWINWNLNEVGFLPDSRRLYFLSEETGTSHLYVAELTARGESHSAPSGPRSARTFVAGPRRIHRFDCGPAPRSEPNEHRWTRKHFRHGLPSGAREVRPVTAGDFEVLSVQISRDGSTAWLVANREHPGVLELYAVPTSNDARVTPDALSRLTTFDGHSQPFVSPDESHVLIRHDSELRPPELYLQELEPGAEAIQLTHSTTPAFDAVAWTPPRHVEIPSSQGGVIHARLYLPPEGAARTAGPDGRRAAVVFTHGAGYLQNAHKGWSDYTHEFMFHSVLTRAGYVVLDPDYRASAGYGRDWRTAIHRRMGEPELVDLRDAVDWLAAEHDVDPQRVGTYGGSYGGFLTLMALFRAPDLFACGAALRPVTDWAHYNDWYTANILNTPDDDPLAYLRSSPIEYAEGLAAPLLICHGMLDDNVFFKDTVRLAQRLIELGKTDWDVALYPVEGHSFSEAASWLDEYRRVFSLFEEHLLPTSHEGPGPGRTRAR